MLSIGQRVRYKIQVSKLLKLQWRNRKERTAGRRSHKLNLLHAAWMLQYIQGGIILW